MPIDGEMLAQVSPAKEALFGRIARHKVRQPRPLVKPQVLCTPCRNMIGAFVANEPRFRHGIDLGLAWPARAWRERRLRAW